VKPEESVIKKSLVAVVVVITALVSYLVTRPGAYKVERSTTVSAVVTIVFGQLEDFKAWPAWSAWDRRDPRMKKTFGGPTLGIGSTLAWQGDDQVGEGKLTIIENEAPIHIKYRVELTRPVAAVGTMTLDLAPQGPEATVVTWTMEGTRDLKGKLTLPFSSWPEKLGQDFAASLASLKQVSEARARLEAKTAAREAARAQAEAKLGVKAAEAARPGP
jgi:hypothetical protein